jgi:hypothetical protein
MKKINEISTSEFRSKIKSLGHSEKGSELTSGGDIKSDFLDIFNKLLEDWGKMNPNGCKLTFTSGNDSYHHKLSYISKHTKGEAIDVVLPNECHKSFIDLLNTYKQKYNGFSYIDEYKTPSGSATGGHFHISYKSGSPENVTTTTNDSTELPTPEISTTPETSLTGKDIYKAFSVQKESKDRKLNDKLINEINKIKNLLK